MNGMQVMLKKKETIKQNKIAGGKMIDCACMVFAAPCILVHLISWHSQYAEHLHMCFSS